MKNSDSQIPADESHPDEGYLDDDFARFRTARLKKQAGEVEAPPPAETDPDQSPDGMFFGTTSNQRRQVASRLREERSCRRFDRSEVRARAEGRARPGGARLTPDPERSPPHGVDIRKLADRARRAS